MSEPYWVALAGGGVDYKGDWASATAYKSGDVVRWNGVEFLAVNPSTGSIPPLAPSAAGVELAYAEQIGDLTIPVVAEASAITVATAPAITVDGATPIIVAFEAHLVQAAAGAYVIFTLWDSSTELGVLAQAQGAALIPMSGSRRLTPSAGAHTYSIRAHAVTSAGSILGAVGGGAGYRLPTFIRVSTSQPIRMGVAIPPTYGTSLPSSPLDGQEAVLVDSLTAPTYAWRFRYDAGITDAYKWVFIGGSPWSGYASGTSTSSQTYATIAGPTFTVPRAGTYDWSLSLQANQDTAYSVSYASVASSIGSAADVLSGRFQALQAGMVGSYAFQGRLTGLAAAAVLQPYGHVTSGIGNFGNQRMMVTPVRVA